MKDVKSVIIIRARGCGKVVIGIIQKSRDRVAGFLDNNPSIGKNFIGFSVLGMVDDYRKFNAEFAITINDVNTCEKITRRILDVI